MRFLLLAGLCFALWSSLGGSKGHVSMLAEGACTTYTVKSGDTCYQISQAHGISLSNFESWNPGIVCDDLQIGQVVCVSNPGSSSFSNGKLFREYIGAEFNGVSFTDVPINSNVEFHFILSFAIDYTSDGSSSTNGQFNVFWDTNLTPAGVQAIKAQHSNVKVMVSLGGDTVNGNYAQFKPSSVSSWVSNAVASLTNLINTYHLDGIDIDYEHFDDTTQQDFVSCIGQLITQLKKNKVISVASIAPFDGVETYYTALWKQYNSVIDYVNFQFYTYDTSTTPSQYVNYYNTAASKYGGGAKVLASFSTETNVGPRPANVILACNQLKSSEKLPGIFVFSADDSYASSAKFQYEQQAQSLLAS